MFGYAADYHELETKEDHIKHNKVKLMSHKGHNHWMTPFDFSEVQISAWFAFIPGIIFMVQNFNILIMDNVEEYQFFKSPRGLKILMICMLASQAELVVYVVTLAVNLAKQMAAGKDLQ